MTGDKGATAVEYVGVLVVVAALVVSIAVAVDGRRITSATSSAVCRILRLVGACESTAPTPQDKAFKPSSCKVQETGQKDSAKVTIAWLSVGSEYGFIRQTFSDGSVRMTMVDATSVGATASGKEKLFDVGKLGQDAKAGASVDVGGGLKYAYGTTWQFADSSAADSFQNQIKAHADEERTMSLGAKFSPFYRVVHFFTAEDPPDPDITFSRTTVDASAKGALGLKQPTGLAPAPGKNPPLFDPNVGGTLTLKGDYEVTKESNRRTGTTSWTYQLGEQAAGAVNGGLAGGELAGRRTGAVKVTRNDKGELVSLTFVHTQQGSLQGSVGVKSPVPLGGAMGNAKDAEKHSQVTVTTSSIALENAADRAVAQAWLVGSNEQFGSPFRLTSASLVPAGTPAPGDAFGQLMNSRGTASRVVYDGVNNVEEFGAEVNMGLKLGFSYTSDNSRSSAVQAQYLGAPRAGGIRPMVDFAECR